MMVTVTNIYSGKERVFTGSLRSIELQMRLVWRHALMWIGDGDSEAVIHEVARMQINLVKVEREE